MLGMGGGTRKRGRPRARRLDDINAITNSYCTLAELCGSAKDRDAWRKMIMAITKVGRDLTGQGDKKVSFGNDLFRTKTSMQEECCLSVVQWLAYLQTN